MAANDRKRRLQAVKRAVKQAVAGDGRAHTVNVARRANVVVAKNVGEDNSFHAAVARQSARIRQNGREMFEESEQADEVEHPAAQ